MFILTIESWSVYENQALHYAVDDACWLGKSAAAGGDKFSHRGEQNLEARASKSHGQKADHS